VAVLKKALSFTVSETTTPDVDVSAIALLAKAVRKSISQKRLEVELSGVVIFPTICDPGVFARPNFKTHKRKENAFFVGVNIGYAEWISSSNKRRLLLARKNFEQAIGDIPTKHLSDESLL
jgi:hypothetical protein